MQLIRFSYRHKEVVLIIKINGMNIIVKSIGWILLFGLISCEKDDTKKDETILIDRSYIAQLKSDALDTLVIGSESYVLDAYIWRDFQPMCPPGGREMISINWLINIDSVKISDNIKMIKQYVINKDSIWISDYMNRSSNSQVEYKIEKISINGPKWGPGINVDVISEIHDFNTGMDYYLECKDVYVGRTD